MISRASATGINHLEDPLPHDFDAEDLALHPEFVPVVVVSQDAQEEQQEEEHQEDLECRPGSQCAELPPSEAAPTCDSATPMPQPPVDGDAPLDSIVVPGQFATDEEASHGYTAVLGDAAPRPLQPNCAGSPAPEGPTSPKIIDVRCLVPRPTAASAPLPVYAYYHLEMHAPSSMPLPACERHQMCGPAEIARPAYGPQQMYEPSLMHVTMPPRDPMEHHMHGPQVGRPRSYEYQQVQGPSLVPPPAYCQVPMAGAVPLHPHTTPQMGTRPPGQQQQQQHFPQSIHSNPDMDSAVAVDRGDGEAEQNRSHPRLWKPFSYLPSVMMLGVSICWVVVLVSGHDSLLRVILPVLLALLYVAIYTPEWICSSTCKFLGHQQQESNHFHYVEELRQRKPSLYFRVSCWHEEIRTRHVSHTDEDGNTDEGTETYKVKVVTHTRKEEYAFTKWADASAALPVLDGCDMTKLYLTKSYGFMDEAGSNKYDCALQDFKRRTPWDTHMDFSTVYEVFGFLEHTLCHLGDSSPCWVDTCPFMLASLLCCSLPYRLALDRKVVPHHHTIRKLIGE